MKIFKKAIAIFASLALCAAFAVIPGVEKRFEGVYENTLRLHVLARSDGAHDQEIKLKVRDEVLRCVAPLLENAGSREEARLAISENLEAIEENCDAFLQTLGEDARARVTLSEEYYPRRDYGGFSYPAGEYLSLRVLIGEGQGRNWWCVVYPPLCLSAADASGTLENSGYTEDEQALLTRDSDGYRVRFFLLDLIGALKNFFS